MKIPFRAALFLAAAALLTYKLMTPNLSSQAADSVFPNPAIDMEKPVKGKQKVVFAGGCFWCTEAVFEQLNGVEKVVSGYAGGDEKTANYKAVGSGNTKHAEAIEVTYDPSKISYGQLMRVFFSVAHDPTQLNRQGPDVGSQYRSAIFYSSEHQKRITEAYIKQLNDAKIFRDRIVTEVAPLDKFYTAEEYHQNFADKNPLNPYCRISAGPKVSKVRKEFPELVKK